MNLTLGVHGPKFVHAILFDDEAESDDLAFEDEREFGGIRFDEPSNLQHLGLRRAIRIRRRITRKNFMAASHDGTDKTWRVAFIGAGTVVQKGHIPGFRRVPGVETVALCDVNDNRVRMVAAETDIPHAFTDYEQMLEQAKPDITVVATPNIFHKPMTMAALEAGSHVLCEKPLALTYADAVEMMDLAEQKGLTLTVGTHYRFSHAHAGGQGARGRRLLRRDLRRPHRVAASRRHPWLRQLVHEHGHGRRRQPAGHRRACAGPGALSDGLPGAGDGERGKCRQVRHAWPGAWRLGSRHLRGGQRRSL